MGLPESMQTLVSCLLIISTFMYFRAAAKSREGLVDDPGTKSEKEAAAASYLRSRPAQNLAKRYPS